jgi:hypothetical protein
MRRYQPIDYCMLMNFYHGDGSQIDQRVAAYAGANHAVQRDQINAVYVRDINRAVGTRGR